MKCCIFYEIHIKCKLKNKLQLRLNIQGAFIMSNVLVRLGKNVDSIMMLNTGANVNPFNLSVVMH